MPGRRSAKPHKNVQKVNPLIAAKENLAKAHEQAERDIEETPDFTIQPEKGDDLDEGELARLEGEK